jgi:hypothetical protein
MAGMEFILRFYNNRTTPSLADVNDEMLRVIAASLTLVCRVLFFEFWNICKRRTKCDFCFKQIEGLLNQSID